MQKIYERKFILIMPRCKNCKEKFDVKYFNQKYCMLKDECIKAFAEYVKVASKKQEKKEDKKLKIVVYEKENKKYLQNEVNKLARMIDTKFNFVTCIDCNKPFGKQIDAAHYHSIGSNSSLRFNLDNLHSAKSDCNKYSNQHISGYKLGLMERYGKQYAEYVISELPLKYPLIKLNSSEVYEKLSLVRKLIRDFNTFDFTDSLQARRQLNNIIDIYK